MQTLRVVSAREGGASHRGVSLPCCFLSATHLFKSNHSQDIHYKKLRETKSTAKLQAPWNAKLNTSKPPTMEMKHLKIRAKKAQQEAERFAEIELENRVLLQKMSSIIKQDPISSACATGGKTSDPFPFRSVLQHKPGLKIESHSYPVTDSRNFAPRRSLNKESRQRELDRISRENTSMLTRIVNRQPVYRLKYWEDERKKDLTYLHNIRSREVMHLGDRLMSSVGPGDLSSPKRSARTAPLPPVTGATPPPAAAAEGGDDAPAAE